MKNATVNAEHPVDQLPLGDEVHEVARDQRALDRGHQQRERDGRGDRQVEVARSPR